MDIVRKLYLYIKFVPFNRDEMTILHRDVNSFSWCRGTLSLFVTYPQQTKMK